MGLFLRFGVQGDVRWGFYARKEGRDRTSGANWRNPNQITQSITSCRVGYGEGMAPTSRYRGRWHRRMGPRDSALMHLSAACEEQVRGDEHGPPVGTVPWLGWSACKVSGPKMGDFGLGWLLLFSFFSFHFMFSFSFFLFLTWFSRFYFKFLFKFKYQ